MKRIHFYKIIYFMFILFLGTNLKSQELTGSLTNGLIGYYKFNGNLNDSSGNGNNLTNNGSFTFSSNQNGIPNSSIAVDYSTAFQSINNTGIAGNNNFTFSIWLNCNTIPSLSTIMSIGDMSGSTSFSVQGLGLRSDASGNLWVWGSNADVWGTNTPTQIDNSWHHFAWSYNGTLSSSSLYYDGSLLNSTAMLFYGVDTLDIPDSPLYLNQGVWGGISGKISDVAIYNRSLSSSEVSQLYTAQSVPEPSTYALFGIGAIGMLMVLRRKKTA